MAIDISGDVALMEGYPDLVTVIQASGTTSNVNSRAFPINQEMVEPTGVCRRYSTSFRIAPDELTVAPVIGETITDAGSTVWTIMDVSAMTFNGGWFIDAINLNINPDTRDRINVFTPVFTTDPWADVLNTPTPTFANVPCAIVPVASGLGGIPTPTPRAAHEYGSKKGMTRFYDIYVLADMDLDYGTLLANANTADTKVYIVEGQTGRASLSNFAIIHAKVLP